MGWYRSLEMKSQLPAQRLIFVARLQSVLLRVVGNASLDLAPSESWV
jgi:hypothetical protein